VRICVRGGFSSKVDELTKNPFNHKKRSVGGCASSAHQASTPVLWLWSAPSHWLDACCTGNTCMAITSWGISAFLCACTSSIQHSAAVELACIQSVLTCPVKPGRYIVVGDTKRTRLCSSAGAELQAIAGQEFPYIDYKRMGTKIGHGKFPVITANAQDRVTKHKDGDNP
jgi:hypothetical protein